MTECGLCTFNKSLTDIRDTESCLMWGGDVVVDDGGQMEGNVVFGHANLLGNLCGTC